MVFSYLLEMSTVPKGTTAKMALPALAIGTVLAPFTGGSSLIIAALHVAGAGVVESMENNSDDSKPQS